MKRFQVAWTNPVEQQQLNKKLIPQQAIEHIIQLNNYCLNIDQDTIEQLQLNRLQLKMHSIEQVAIEHWTVTIEHYKCQARQAVAFMNLLLFPWTVGRTTGRQSGQSGPVVICPSLELLAKDTYAVANTSFIVV